jgi:hypothetical protein
MGNPRKALSIASHGYVQESGRISSEGRAGNLLKSPQILAAHLGETCRRTSGRSSHGSARPIGGSA